MYPSTITILSKFPFLATFSPNKCLPFVYTMVSGEFIYFGNDLSNTLPPKAITFPRISMIGIISLFLNLSIY